MKICNIRFRLEAREADRVSIDKETGKTNEQRKEGEKKKKTALEDFLLPEFPSPISIRQSWFWSLNIIRQKYHANIDNYVNNKEKRKHIKILPP